MVNAANTYMLYAWLAHQILLSVATLSVPNYNEKMKNNMPPACKNAPHMFASGACLLVS